jgi:hypothetical protein
MDVKKNLRRPVAAFKPQQLSALCYGRRPPGRVVTGTGETAAGSPPPWGRCEDYPLIRLADGTNRVHR